MPLRQKTLVPSIWAKLPEWMHFTICCRPGCRAICCAVPRSIPRASPARCVRRRFSTPALAARFTGFPPAPFCICAMHSPTRRAFRYPAGRFWTARRKRWRWLGRAWKKKVRSRIRAIDRKGRPEALPADCLCFMGMR